MKLFLDLFTNSTVNTTLDMTTALLQHTETTTGSGQGTTSMNVRTIVKELQRNCSPIGQGRFGIVYLSTFREDPVAVKYFRPECEDSFRNEASLLHKPSINLRDDSVVGFIGIWDQIFVIFNKNFF